MPGWFKDEVEDWDLVGKALERSVSRSYVTEVEDTTKDITVVGDVVVVEENEEAEEVEKEEDEEFDVTVEFNQFNVSRPDLGSVPNADLINKMKTQAEALLGVKE